MASLVDDIVLALTQSRLNVVNEQLKNFDSENNNSEIATLLKIEKEELEWQIETIKNKH